MSPEANSTALQAAQGDVQRVDLERYRLQAQRRQQRAVYVAIVGAALVLSALVPSILAPAFWRPIGAIALTVGLGACVTGLALRFTPNLLTLLRRELSAYFLSPIAYMMLFGLTVIAALNFLGLVSFLSRGGEAVRRSAEPVFSFAWGWPSFCVLIIVPIATMRTFSEERRSGTLEVLLTAPVTEADVVLSKFFASLLFYMAAWAPWLFYLLVLRWVGRLEFDFGPPAAAFLGLLVAGCTFIAGGMVFSSLTRNQIIAAVLSFAMMLVLYIPQIFEQLFELWNWDQAYVDAMRYLSFGRHLQEFGQGTIDLRYVMLHLSAATVLLFVIVKVLESRSWR